MQNGTFYYPWQVLNAAHRWHPTSVGNKALPSCLSTELLLRNPSKSCWMTVLFSCKVQQYKQSREPRAAMPTVCTWLCHEPNGHCLCPKRQKTGQRIYLLFSWAAPHQTARRIKPRKPPMEANSVSLCGKVRRRE